MRFLIVTMLVVSVLSGLGALGSDDSPMKVGEYPDGVYFAMEEEFGSNGWKDAVTVSVEEGQIDEVKWSGVHVMGGPDKRTLSVAGGYAMMSQGNAQSEWHVQARSAEEWLVDHQDPTMMTYSDPEGHTDVLTSATMRVKVFFELAEKALAAGPVGYGPYIDGYYRAEDRDFDDSGWKNTAQFTVLGGYVVSALWNGVNPEGDTKKLASKEGRYPMVTRGGAQSEWYEQAALVEEYFMATQGRMPSITGGRTDAITGATVTVLPFYALAEIALPRK